MEANDESSSVEAEINDDQIDGEGLIENIPEQIALIAAEADNDNKRDRLINQLHSTVAANFTSFFNAESSFYPFLIETRLVIRLVIKLSSKILLLSSYYFVSINNQSFSFEGLDIRFP